MNARFVLASASVAALLLLTPNDASLNAATIPADSKARSPAQTGSPVQRTAVNRRSEAELLRQAYTMLSLADHDYKGHRIKAMKHIEAAANLLSVDLRGDGKGREKQALSDAQLREAQGLLEEVQTELAGKRQPRILTQVNAAITEISTALKIR